MSATEGVDRFRAEWLHEFDVNLDDEWLIKWLFPKVGVVSWFGASRAFKTFILIHIFYSIATGRAVAGRKVKNQGPVVYIAAEDPSGVKKRMAGYHTANPDLPLRDQIPFSVIKSIPNLGSMEGDAKELIASVLLDMYEKGYDKPAAIAIDTLNRTLGGESENGEGMQMFLINAAQVAERIGCCVFAVNHIGHKEEDRERGASSIQGNTEVRVQVKRLTNDDESFRSRLWFHKVKNGDDNFGLDVTLSKFLLGTDSDGDEATTLVVDSVKDADIDKHASGDKPEKAPSRAQSLRHEFLTMYHQLANDVDPSPGIGGNSQVRKVRVDAIRDLLITRGHLERDGKGKLPGSERVAFTKAKAALAKTGAGQTMVEADGLIWLLRPERVFNVSFSKDS